MRRIVFFLLAAATLCCHTRLFAQSKLNTAKLDSLFLQLDRHDRAMCAVLLSKNGRTLFHREIGYEHITTNDTVRVSAETEYRIGSISKMFAAAIVFQLIEEGKLTLGTTLSTYFPQIPNADKITIEEMLGHRSGLFEYTNSQFFTIWMTKPKTEEQMVEIIAKGKPMFAPEEKADYSNANYLLLGYIIEKITGKPYPEVFDTRIAKKIHLQHTYFGGMIGTKPHEAVSFSWAGSSWTPAPEWDLSIIGAAGGVVSTTSDLAMFIDALFKRKIVSDSSLKRMTTLRGEYGLGILDMSFHGQPGYGHTGHIDNFLSEIRYFPNDSSVSVFISNGLNYEGSQILNGVLRIYHHLPFHVPTFNDYAPDPLTFAQYDGTYESKALGMKITVKADNGKLTAQATGQDAFPLSPLEKDAFQFMEGGIIIRFRRGAAEFVTGLKLIQEGEEIGFEKID